MKYQVVKSGNRYAVRRRGGLIFRRWEYKCFGPFTETANLGGVWRREDSKFFSLCLISKEKVSEWLEILPPTSKDFEIASQFFGAKVKEE